MVSVQIGKELYRVFLLLYIFFCLGFHSQTFTNHRTAGEEGGHFFKSSLPLPPLHRHLDISRAITAESSPRSRAQTGNLWLPLGTYVTVGFPQVSILVSLLFNYQLCWNWLSRIFKIKCETFCWRHLSFCFC